MKPHHIKVAEAIARREARAKRTDDEQTAILLTKPGHSAKEIKRLYLKKVERIRERLHISHKTT